MSEHTDGGPPDGRTRIARVVKFLTFVALLDLLALALAARFTPPDPVTQALTVGPMLLVSPVVAYWLVYVDGLPDAT